MYSPDPLDEIFAAMRVDSALYARLEVTTPWGVHFTRGKMARFGLVVRGGCWLSVEGVARPIALTVGDCYVIVHGAPYILRDDLRTPTRSCVEVIRDKIGGVVGLGGGGAASTVITGWFMFDELGARPLMELLPAVLHTRFDDRRTDVLKATLQLLAMETAEPGLGSRIVVSRLADIVFVQAVRAHVASSGAADLGWLAALADERLGAALEAIHRDVARSWNIAELATLAGLSRSAFALRFKRRVGESPFTYLTRWRMFRAGNLLRHGERSLAEIATLVGYESDVAFNKAFRRTLGTTPGSYRRQAPSSAASASSPVR